MSGRISFIGAGPGAADLITMRGARRLAEADVVVWSASQVAPECIWENARTDAEMVDSSRLRHEEAVELFRRAERDRLRVVRMHAGDPSLWGEVEDQYDACARMQLEVEVVPGVAAVSAAAASVGRELTTPEVARSVVLARLDGGKAPMPDGTKVRELARHGTTMAVSLAAARVAQLAEELREGGYAEDTPVLVAYKVSLPDEQVLRTTLGELEAAVKQRKLWRNALFLVGHAVAGPRARYGSGSRGVRGSEGTGWSAGRSSAQRRSAQAPSAPAGAAPAAPAGASGASEQVPHQRFGARNSSSSESDVAWWAVREWQDSARGGTRVASRSAAARQVEQRHQDALFAGESGESEGERSESGPVADVVNLSAQRQSRVDSARADAGASGSPSDVVFASDSSTEVPAGESGAESASAGEESRSRPASASLGQRVVSARSAAKAESAGSAAPAGAEDPAAEPGSTPGEQSGAEPEHESSGDGGEVPKKATKSRSSKSTSKTTSKSSSGSKSGKAASPRRKSASGKQNQRAGESSGQESGPESE